MPKVKIRKVGKENHTDKDKQLVKIVGHSIKELV